MASEILEGKLYSYSNTLAVAFEHPLLSHAIQSWAEAKGIDIFELEPESLDIIVAGHFAAVIDRNVLGLGIYDTYLCCMEDVNSSTLENSSMTEIEGETDSLKSRQGGVGNVGLEDIHNTSSLIIVDKRRDLAYPELDFVAQIDPDAEFGIERIVGVLEEARLLEKRRKTNE